MHQTPSPPNSMRQPSWTTLTNQVSGVPGWPGPRERGDNERIRAKAQPQGEWGEKCRQARKEVGWEQRQLEKEAAQQGGASGVLTTSSMTGSGLAASSCSFTFSSTRGRKNNTGLLGRSCRSRGSSLRGPREEGAPLSSQVEGRPQGPERGRAGYSWSGQGPGLRLPDVYGR